MAFPSEGNFCHKANPAAAVSREHQSAFCLTEQHAACPVFLAQTAAPLPAALASRETHPARTSKTLRTPILLALLLIFSLVGTWISISRSAARVMALSGSPAPVGSEVEVPFTGQNASPTPSQPGELRPTQTLSSDQQAGQLAGRECPLPRGWQTYTVQSTDSIYRISILYAVGVDALQQANCLDERTSLRTGETFYVPARSPTATATARATATRTPTQTRTRFIAREPLEDTSSDDDEDGNNAPIATLTRAPVVRTSVPTATQPVQPTATSNPPTPTVRVIVPTLPIVPTATQPPQPTAPPATAIPPTPTDEPVIVPTNPPPTQPPPTQAPQPTDPPVVLPTDPIPTLDIQITLPPITFNEGSE